MFAFDSLWSWLIRAAILSSLVLIVGLLATSRVRQPAERLRLIQWVLAACLIIPWLPVSTAWRTVSVDLNVWSEPSVEPSAVPIPTTSASIPEPFPNGDESPKPAAIATAAATAQRGDSGRAQLKPAPGISSPARGQKVPPERAESRPLSLPGMIVVGWLLSLLTMIVCGLAGLWLRFSLQRRGRPASPALLRVFEEITGPAGRGVRLITSDTIDSPITWGALRPVILVPRKFDEESVDGELRWALAHEWSHVKQRDFATLCLAMAVQFVYFYQPLYWLLRRRMILCQDYIADAFAARHSDSTEDFAAFLVRLAKSRLQPAPSLALGIVDYRSQLFQRVKMLVDPRADVRPDCRKRFTVLTACGSLICLLLLTTIQLDAASEPKEARASAGPAATTSDVAAESTSTSETTGTIAPEEEPREAGVVSGILIDAADGKPVAGARVLLRGGILSTTTSDEAGRFRFEKLGAYKLGYRLWAYRDNLITGKAPVEQLPIDDGTTVGFKPLRLEMKPGKQARFVVTSKETGRPIPKAAVRFGYPDRRNVPTGDDGAVTVAGLMPQHYDVTVEAEGYARNTPQIDLAQAEAVTEYAIALVPGGEIRGVALDGQGQPVSDAEVTYREGGNGRGYHGDAFRTDAEGKFRHRFLPLNVPLEVSINKDDYVRTKQDISLSTGRRSREVRVTLRRRPPGASVAGVVRDRNGDPLANAQVANYGNSSAQKRLTTTDAQGRFVLHDLFERSTGIDVWVSATGFSPQRLPVKRGSAEAPAEIAVTLEPGHSLEGRVVTEAGDPVSGAYVMARNGAFRMGMESTRTDKEGAFAFDSLPPDVQFQVSHSQYPSTGNMPLSLDSSEPVTVTLEDPGLIRGQVVDAETRQPLRQFRIRLGFSRSRQPGDARGTYASTWGDPGLTFQTDDGRFTIGPLTARMPLELIVQADGYDRLVVPRAVAAKAKDSQEIAISLKSKVAGEPYSLTVQFLDGEGQPIPNAQLRLIVSTNQPTGSDDNAFNWALIDSGQLGRKSYVEQFLPGVTNAEGKCEFKNIVPGKYLQLAYWGDGVPKGRSLAFDETRPGQSDSVVIDVPRPAIVRGSVDRSQFPDAGAVRLTGAFASFLSFQAKLAEDQSTFELRDLPPGDCWISVVSKPVRFTENGHEMSRISPLASKRLVLKPGEVKEVRFDTPDPPR